jgi:F-type H+-transporting ATPase subunit b
MRFSLKVLGTFLLITGLVLTQDLLASEEGGYSAEQWKEFGLRCMNFVVFAVILYFLLRNLVKNFFQSKKEGISRTIEYLETQAKNLEEQNQVMQRRLSKLSQEREGILAQYERDGQKERDRIIAEANATADQIVKKSQTAISQELTMAKRKLTQDTGGMAVDMAGDIIAQNITKEDKDNLVHGFLEQLTKLSAKH